MLLVTVQTVYVPTESSLYRNRVAFIVTPNIPFVIEHHCLQGYDW